MSPLKLIRTKMHSKKFSYMELHQFVSKKISKDSWISLWRGWASTVLRDVPFSAMYWCNWSFKEVVVWKIWFRRSSIYDQLYFRGKVWFFVAVETLSFDVVKTKKQIQLWMYESHKISMPLGTCTWANYRMGIGLILV